MSSALSSRVAAVRRFNRFYTQKIGALGEGHLASAFSLTEVRVLYELAHRDEPTASELGRALDLDAGYLSRILRHFTQRGLVRRSRSTSDGRNVHLQLTKKGERAFVPLEAKAGEAIASLLRPLPAKRQDALLRAMQHVQTLLDAAPAAPPRVTLRSHRPGDMGWIVHRHGELYHQEYGFDETFEALVAEIAAKFIREFDRQRERCWVAEVNGEIVGSVFLVRQSDDVAKLRLLLVEPNARGLGLGKRLVNECTRFALEVGYKRITLWTQSILHAARKIYEREGYELVREEPHHSFGCDLVAQTWEKDLRSEV
ncbi:MAG TPA: bifunctional helix-turn-helix transcriptional regulator/GNAT family N-acetyltransferase [Gemmatimonadaceae bacterium]|nr:bifunctional helix-turn-helix transcriptional regulator/GNAT family N-acetyltransferase [Gemmatimonadaceae bacterium]